MDIDGKGNGFLRSRSPAIPVHNWSTLSRSDEVEVRRNGRFIAAGRIDMLALDGSMVWILKEQGNDRALFLRSDGINLYRRAGKGTRPLSPSPGQAKT